MKPFRVRFFEPKATRPPLQLESADWHGPAIQERMCVNCQKVMIEGTGRLILGRYCGKCWVATDPQHAA